MRDDAIRPTIVSTESVEDGQFFLWKCCRGGGQRKTLSPPREMLFAPVLGLKGVGTSRAAVPAIFLVESDIERKESKE